RYPHPVTLHSFPTRRSSDLSHRPGGTPQPPHDASTPLACRRDRNVRSTSSHRTPARRNATAVSPTPTAPDDRNTRGRGSRSASEDRKSTRLNSSHVSISYAV